MKKTIALILAAVLLGGVLTACGTQREAVPATGSDISETPAAEQHETPAAEVTGTVRSYSELRRAFDADTVVLTVNGRDVQWHELFFWITSAVDTLEANYGEVKDFSAAFLDEGPDGSYQAYVLQSAIDAVSQYRALDGFAEALGAELSEESRNAIRVQEISDMGYVGVTDEEDFNDSLYSMNMTRELYDYLNRDAYLVGDCFAASFGADGSGCSDAEALAYAEENEFVQVKHLLFSTTDDANEPLSESEIAQKREKAEAARQTLLAADDREAAMDAMLSDSDDPGSTYYTDGYVFTHGKMVQAFEDASYALEVGGVSEVVETDYGFHVILRLPLDIDAAVEYVSADEQYSLRYYAASAIFNERLGDAMDSAEAVRLPVLETLDLQALLNG